MPAWQVTGTPVKVDIFDAVGYYTGGPARFVDHVALANEAHAGLVIGDELSLMEMEPPLRNTRRRSVDAIGTAVLTADEVLQIRNFCRGQLNEHVARKLINGPGKLKGYVVVPHAKPFQEAGAVTVTMRFSCAGFVIMAYHEAGIDFIATDPSALVRVHRDALAQAIPFLAGPNWASFNERFDLGLDPTADGWPVVLPGYVLHALDRSPSEIRSAPYSPQRGDELYP